MSSVEYICPKILGVKNVMIKASNNFKSIILFFFSPLSSVLLWLWYVIMLHQDQKRWLIFARVAHIMIACSGMLHYHTKTAKQPKMWHASKNKALGINGHFVIASHQSLLTEETHGLCQGHVMGQGKWGQSVLCSWVGDDGWRLWQLPIVALQIKRTKVHRDF